jgi:hypothetical protein
MNATSSTVMKFHLAEINIARFRLPFEHPVNTDFVRNLDRVNAEADRQPGFVWRFVGAGNNAFDVRAFDDPKMAINMSVWTDMESLAAYAYRNEAHRDIMRRRREWFDKIDFNLALWWIPMGQLPTVEEGKAKLDLLARLGPTADAFVFSRPFPAPDAQSAKAIFDECA